MERSGGVAAIVLENRVRQGYCYTCLAIGGGCFGRVTKGKEIPHLHDSTVSLPAQRTWLY